MLPKNTLFINSCFWKRKKRKKSYAPKNSIRLLRLKPKNSIRIYKNFWLFFEKKQLLQRPNANKRSKNLILDLLFAFVPQGRKVYLIFFFEICEAGFFFFHFYKQNTADASLPNENFKKKPNNAPVSQGRLINKAGTLRK